MRFLLLILCIAILTGCETTEKVLFGLDKEERAQEIEEAYQRGEITQTEYLELKKQNETY